MLRLRAAVLRHALLAGGRPVAVPASYLPLLNARAVPVRHINGVRTFNDTYEKLLEDVEIVPFDPDNPQVSEEDDKEWENPEFFHPHYRLPRKMKWIIYNLFRKDPENYNVRRLAKRFNLDMMKVRVIVRQQHEETLLREDLERNPRPTDEPRRKGEQARTLKELQEDVDTYDKLTGSDIRMDGIKEGYDPDFDPSKYMSAVDALGTQREPPVFDRQEDFRPHYKLLSDEQFIELVNRPDPPPLVVRSPPAITHSEADKVIVGSNKLVANPRSAFVFTDISGGAKDVHRKILVRQTNGDLRTVTQRERAKLTAQYFGKYRRPLRETPGWTEELTAAVKIIPPNQRYPFYAP